MSTDTTLYSPACPFTDLSLDMESLDDSSVLRADNNKSGAAAAMALSLLSKTIYSRMSSNVALTSQQSGVCLAGAAKQLVQNKKITQGVAADVISRPPQDVFRTGAATAIEATFTSPLLSTCAASLLIGATDAAVSYVKDRQAAKSLGIVSSSAQNIGSIAKDLTARAGLSAVGAAIFCASHRVATDFIRRESKDYSATFGDDISIAAATGVITGVYASASAYVTNQAMIDGGLKLDHARPSNVVKHIASKPALVASMAMSVGMAAYAKSQSDRFCENPQHLTAVEDKIKTPDAYPEPPKQDPIDSSRNMASVAKTMMTHAVRSAAMQAPAHVEGYKTSFASQYLTRSSPATEKAL